MSAENGLPLKKKETKAKKLFPKGNKHSLGRSKLKLHAAQSSHHLVQNNQLRQNWFAGLGVEPRTSRV